MMVTLCIDEALSDVDVDVYVDVDVDGDVHGDGEKVSTREITVLHMIESHDNHTAESADCAERCPQASWTQFYHMHTILGISKPAIRLQRVAALQRFWVLANGSKCLKSRLAKSLCARFLELPSSCLFC